MPKVTLLEDEDSTYAVPFGKAVFVFKGGKPKDVPSAVALFCKDKKKPDGSPQFIVEEMPNVVSSANVKTEKKGRGKSVTKAVRSTGEATKKVESEIEKSLIEQNGKARLDSINHKLF